MSERELRNEKASKTIVGSTFVLLVGLLLLLSTLSSCSSVRQTCGTANNWNTSCPAYR